MLIVFIFSLSKVSSLVEEASVSICLQNSIRYVKNEFCNGKKQQEKIKMYEQNIVQQIPVHVYQYLFVCFTNKQELFTCKMQ